MRVILRVDGLLWEEEEVRKCSKTVEVSQLLRILNVEGVDEVALQCLRDSLGVLLSQRLQVGDRLVNMLHRQLLGVLVVP